MSSPNPLVKNTYFNRIDLLRRRTYYTNPSANDIAMSWFMLAKQAKTLTRSQIALLKAFLAQTRYPARNTAVLLLSVKAGLRAKEIASLTWDMLTDAEGNLGPALHLRNSASKGKSGRVIPLNKDLREVLQELHRQRDSSSYVITTERSQRMSAAAIVNLFVLAP